eukprot:m.540961 g.540961  ORF g.540961 m.540961 type:complete len:933 (-) comp22104_c0_seq12:133-2931(-)
MSLPEIKPSSDGSGSNDVSSESVSVSAPAPSLPVAPTVPKKSKNSTTSTVKSTAKKPKSAAPAGNNTAKSSTKNITKIGSKSKSTGGAGKKSSSAGTAKAAKTPSAPKPTKSSKSSKTSVTGKLGKSSPSKRTSEQATEAREKEFALARAHQHRTLKFALQKRGIPLHSPALQDAKRRKVDGQVLIVPPAFLASDDRINFGGSASDGECGMAEMMEHDGWPSPVEDTDDDAWADAWAAGMSASDDDSDGDGEEWLKATDAFTPEEIVKRRTNHLRRLQQLYRLQYTRLKRVLEAKHTAYVKARTKANAKYHKAFKSTAPMPSHIPAGKKKLGDPTTIAIDDADTARTHQHRYNRASGPIAALALQKLRRIETGCSYPYALQSHLGTAGPASKLRCSVQGTTCYNCMMPFSRFCHRHIMNDPRQLLYVQCTATPDEGESPCTNTVLRPTVPRVCEKCITLGDYARNPRISHSPPPDAVTTRTEGLEDADGDGLEAAALGLQGTAFGDGSAYGADTLGDVDDLEMLHALVGGSETLVGGAEDLVGGAAEDGIGHMQFTCDLTSLMGQLGEAESRAVAELQSDLAGLGSDSDTTPGALYDAVATDDERGGRRSVGLPPDLDAVPLQPLATGFALPDPDGGKDTTPSAATAGTATTATVGATSETAETPASDSTPTTTDGVVGGDGAAGPATTVASPRRAADDTGDGSAPTSADTSAVQVQGTGGPAASTVPTTAVVSTAPNEAGAAPIAPAKASPDTTSSTSATAAVAAPVTTSTAPSQPGDGASAVAAVGSSREAERVAQRAGLSVAADVEPTQASTASAASANKASSEKTATANSVPGAASTGTGIATSLGDVVSTAPPATPATAHSNTAHDTEVSSTAPTGLQPPPITPTPTAADASGTCATTKASVEGTEARGASNVATKPPSITAPAANS